MSKGNEYLNDSKEISLSLPSIVWTHYNNGHYTDAIQNLGKVVEGMLFECYKEIYTDEPAKVNRIEQIIFKKGGDKNKKLVYLNEYNSQSLIDEQEGYADLITGFFMAFRNTTSHHGYEITESECLNIMALGDLIIKKLNSRKLKTHLDFNSATNQLNTELQDIILDLVDEIEGYYEHLDLKMVINQTYIAYKLNNKNIFEIVTKNKKTSVDIYLDIPFEVLKDTDKYKEKYEHEYEKYLLYKNKKGVGHLGTGSVLYKIEPKKYDSSYLIGLINEAIEYNQENY
jgi:hypothetical protein